MSDLDISAMRNVLVGEADPEVEPPNGQVSRCEVLVDK